MMLSPSGGRRGGNEAKRGRQGRVKVLFWQEENKKIKLKIENRVSAIQSKLIEANYTSVPLLWIRYCSVSHWLAARRRPSLFFNSSKIQKHFATKITMMIGDQILENGAWRGFLLLVNYKNAERLVYSINHICIALYFYLRLSVFIKVLLLNCKEDSACLSIK